MCIRDRLVCNVALRRFFQVCIRHGRMQHSKILFDFGDFQSRTDISIQRILKIRVSNQHRRCQFDRISEIFDAHPGNLPIHWNDSAKIRFVTAVKNRCGHREIVECGTIRDFSAEDIRNVQV